MDSLSKKRILLGTCDIGNGHINRQKLVIRELLKCNVELVLAVTTNSISQFDLEFPEIKKILISIPWITCNNEGVDFRDTLKRYKDSGKDQFGLFLDFAAKAQECFNGAAPDLVISDYEANVAQFAYAMNIPLICMEQHSQFLYLDNEVLDGFTINEAAARLRYFFPKVDHRFIPSIFPISIDENNKVTVLPPIVRKLRRKEIDERKIVVYFSPYSDDVKQFERVLDMLTERSDYHFVIYSGIGFKGYEKYPQFAFKEIGEEFKEDISDCCCIISSAGHQLISEAIFLNIPLFVFYFSTYDQRYHARMVEKYGLGEIIKRYDKKEFEDFLDKLDLYRRQITEFMKEYRAGSWEDIFLDVLNTKFGINKIQ